MSHYRIARGWITSVLALTLLAAPVHAETVSPLGGLWRHIEGPSEPAGWRAPGYDDSGWAQGPGILGYGETYITTTLGYGPNASSKWITTYFRRSFTLADTATITGAILSAHYDDGFVAYLNGVEVARSGIAAGPITWGTLASLHEGGVAESVPLTVTSASFRTGTNVLAVEVHQNAGTSSDLVWDAALALDRGVLVPTRGPYLQSPAPTQMVVRWRTTTANIGRVSLGAAPNGWTASFDEAAPTTEHELVLTGLAPDTRYYYGLSAVGGYAADADSSFTFRTPPLAGSRQPIRAWVWGDGGLDNADSRAVRDAFIARTRTQPADVGLMLGDNAYTSGTDSEYQSGCFGLLQSVLKRLPLLSTRGNHEVLAAGANNDYYDFFSLPSAGQSGGVVSGTEAYYSFDWANVHFICLDSEGTDRTLGGDMVRWLRQDIAASQADWNIAFWHHPAYTKGSHDSDNITDSGGRMRDMRENIIPILDSTGVDVVLAGHSHVYERSYLIRGHYDVSGTFTESMKVQPGDGRVDGTGPYTKATNGTAPLQGIVHSVVGSASQLDVVGSHPAMVAKISAFGSMLIDVDGNRLEARFLDKAGVVRDSFTILKPQVLDAPPVPRPLALRFGAPRPNPARQGSLLTFTLPSAGRVDLAILDVTGRVVSQLISERRDAGEHQVQWRGADPTGRPVPAGVYYARLEWNGEKRLQRVVRLR